MAALDAQTVCKAHYDACAFFKDKIHLLDNALEKHEHSLREAISDTLTGKGTVKRGLLNQIVSQIITQRHAINLYVSIKS